MVTIWLKLAYPIVKGYFYHTNAAHNNHSASRLRSAYS